MSSYCRTCGADLISSTDCTLAMLGYCNEYCMVTEKDDEDDYCGDYYPQDEDEDENE